METGTEGVVVLRAHECARCPAFRPGEQVMFRGRHVVLQGSHAICIWLLEHIRPLTDALELGTDLASFGIDLEGGRFHCQDRGCSAVFTTAREPLPAVPLPAPPVAPAPADPGASPFRIADLTQTAPVPDAPLPEVAPESFLGRLAPELARTLVAAAENVRYQDGEHILTEGAPGEALFILQSGSIRVVRENEDGSELELARLQPGECFGEMSLLTGEACTASVIASEDCTVYRLPADRLDEVMARNPALHRSFSQIFAQRLQKTSTRFNDQITQGITGKLSVISFTEIVQAIVFTQRTGTIILNRPGGDAGWVYFDKGQVVAAAAEGQEGEEAFFALMRWSTGTFTFEAGERDAPRNIESEVMGLMMEGARRMDDTGRAAP